LGIGKDRKGINRVVGFGDVNSGDKCVVV